MNTDGACMFVHPLDVVISRHQPDTVGNLQINVTGTILLQSMVGLSIFQSGETSRSNDLLSQQRKVQMPSLL